MQNYSSYNKKKLEQLGLDLLQWIKADGNWLMSEFWNTNEILPEWIEPFRPKSKKFNQCYILALDIQKSKIIKMLSDKSFSSSGMGMVAKNIIGWNDATKTDVTVTDVTEENLDKIFNRLFTNSKAFTKPDNEEEVNEG